MTDPVALTYGQKGQLMLELRRCLIRLENEENLSEDARNALVSAGKALARLRTDYVNFANDWGPD
ncbi:hypothetical protein ACFSM5_21375 [Lacibacterium aquatile]|uniref:Uncharacterized protein n=1 Tax=Lacibacterium aquatile TaxID=1168082 RepID=A0ABW5DWG8_9PROT